MSMVQEIVLRESLPTGAVQVSHLISPGAGSLRYAQPFRFPHATEAVQLLISTKIKTPRTKRSVFIFVEMAGIEPACE